ncbi:MAG TPA: Ig-like domain-containing protein [Bacteroidota bacterium]|nr:Ig-like domain-containing protein [Bacteroidota bacterium]
MSKRIVLAALCAAAVFCASAQQKGLRIVASSPQGVITGLDQSQTIFATFSEPMVALQAVPKDSGSGPMTIAPPLRGKFRWMGTITLAFIPDQLLPYSTHFTVKIPAGTTSKNGTVLPNEFSWTFDTPRPAIAWTSPGNTQNHVDTSTAIILRFNQPVDPLVVAKFTSISVARPGRVAVYPAFSSAAPADTEKIEHPEQVVILRSKESFGMAAAVNVTVKEGVTGREGPLPMQAAFGMSFSTWGGLTFGGVVIPQGGIMPQTGITLAFSNGVTPAELLKHLSFQPPLKTTLDYYSNETPTGEVYLPLPILPESTYTGVITAGLHDMYGNVLKSDQHFSFHVEPYLPFVRTRTGIGVLEGYESHRFPVSTMNVDTIGIQMGEVNPEKIVPLMLKLSWDYYTKLAIDEGVLLTPSSLSEDAREFTKSKLFLTKSKRNVVAVRPLNFDDVIGKDGRGVVFVQVDDMAKQNPAFLKTLVQVTDFGITAKFSPDSNLIWVTHLKDASPVAGASVEIRNDSNRVVWRGVTDERGLAMSPGWGKLRFTPPPEEGEGEEEEWNGDRSQPQQWVIVGKDNDIAFTSSRWDEGIEPYRFDLSYDWNPRPVAFEAQLFSDRGLYKAGERVDIKGIVRARSGGAWHVASGIRTRLVIKNSRNEDILTQDRKLSPFGSFASSVTLKPSAPLGYYSMALSYESKAKGATRWKVMESGSFRVEAFRPAEFDVTAKFDRKDYTLGDTVRGFFNARYLFGAPLKDGKIRWRLTASRSYFSPPGLDGYFFEPLGWLTRFQNEFSGRELQNRDTTLDNLGGLAIAAPLRVGELRGAISLLLEGDVTSPTRQMLSGRTSVLVHAGEFYVGIRPSSTFVKTDTAMALSIVAATKEGTLVPANQVTLRIYQRVWHSVRKAETGGRYAWYSVPSDSLIDSTVVTTQSEPVVRSFTPAGPGFYFVDADAKDARGNLLNAEAYFYASGTGYVAWERRNDDRIDLVANKTAFQPGETASIIVKNPYERATALVSVEREGILTHYTTTLVGSAPQIDIPITSAYLPNVFVSVVLLQGRTDAPTSKAEADVGRPSFKVGYVALSVSPKEKKLAVTVEPDKKEYRPGDTVAVKITLRDLQGKPKKGEVTLSVADLGVLNLIGYRLPNPFDWFYRERPLAVLTTETLMHIIEQRSYDEKGQEVGGGGAAMRQEADIPDAEGIRKEFRASAYWNPSILTGEDGTAVVRFKLPDNLTGFQVMAVAETKESDFGYGDNSFMVNKPLLLQPSLPRFARVGDKFRSGVVIMNYTDAPQEVELVTQVTGLKWSNEDTTRHALQPGQAREVLFAFSAEKIGTAKFIFRAKTAQNRDGLQWTIPVTAPRLKETVALYESLPDSSRVEHIQPPADAYRDIGDVQFTEASTAMVGLSGGISYLFHYPYGCLEQRSSAVLPMILAKDLVEAFKFDVLAGKDYRAVVAKTLDEIPLFQHSNGGFSYWKNEGRTYGYVSAYAMFTLAQAQRNGYQVDKHCFDEGLKYLRRALHGEEKDDYWKEALYDQCTRALILYTLALVGQPDFGYMENLYASRNVMPLFAKAYLLKALHSAGGNVAMQEELVRELTNMVKIAPTSAHFEERSDYDLWWCWDSNTRTTALIMQALVETQPESPIIPKVVRWLIDQQKVGRWRTTQENIYVVDALATYLRAYEKEEPDFRAKIEMEGRTILDELFKGRSFRVAQANIPMSDLQGGKDYAVDLTKTGPGRLYYGIRMNYYPTGETVAKEEGFAVVKTVETLAGGGADTVASGAMLKVTLTVSSRQYRHFVVVDDPVPAGYEVVNTSFQTTGANLEDQEGERGDDWYEEAFHHVEKYDDHVLLFADEFTPGAHTYTYLVQATRTGVFSMPATRAEGMYEPEVFGQTASKAVGVR